MKNLILVLMATSIMLLSSCHPFGKSKGEFKLLPQPKSMEITGSSKMMPGSIKHYRLADGIKLPVPAEYVQNMEETNTLSETQVVFRRDQDLALDDEEYILDITRDRVTIS